MGVVVRYVPYFGDDDRTGVDVSFYDMVPGEMELETDSEQKLRNDTVIQVIFLRVS